MSRPVKDGAWALTEKEKQTLRLIVRGHDAKSTARSLGLSVHTINERLRDARRKMAVSSSREAARLLLEVEGSKAAQPDPDLLRDTGLGDDASSDRDDQKAAPSNGARLANRHPWHMIGGYLMLLTIGLWALTALSPLAAPPLSAPMTETATPDAAIVDTARAWLTLVDQGQWDKSYEATGSAFRKLNTAQVWASTSEKVRVPLGNVISRTFLSQENLPAPPAGYEVVKFRTHFANKAETIETVTLELENDAWRVVGVTIG